MKNTHTKRVGFLAAVAGFALCASAGGAGELLTPFRVEANGKPIDMELGSCSPYVMDFDGDGKFDLLLGQRGECKLRIFRNQGDNRQPKFGVSAYFKAGGVDASLPGG
jgi:hypothetical protein